MPPVKRLVSLSIAIGLAGFTVVGSRAISHQAVLAQNAILPQQRQLIAQRQSRIALVIGNAAYDEGALANPVNDATDIATAFEELGFEVTLLQNQNKREMEDAIEAFSRKLRKGSVGVFYYAGHGLQVNGENYLIPIKARLQSEKDASYDAVPLGKALNAMEASGNLWNVVIIDACRDNPFYRRWYRSNSARGLTAVTPPNGIIIAYSTKAGSVAEDGAGLRNSPFTSALLEKIKKSDLDVRLMFGEVTELVVQKTDKKQVPWTEGNLIGRNFYLNPTNDAPKILVPPALSQPLNIPTSPSLRETASQSLGTSGINLESFRRFNIDILYLEGRKDLKSLALSIKNVLDKYPLNRVQLREFNRKQGEGLRICPWFEVRYDIDEIEEAKSIKYVLENSFLNLFFTLEKGKTSLVEGKYIIRETPNYLSIFITDSTTLSIIYPETDTFLYLGIFCKKSRQ